MRLIASHDQLRALKRRKRRGIRKNGLRWIRPTPMTREERRASRLLHRLLWQGFESSGLRCFRLERNGALVDVETYRKELGL